MRWPGYRWAAASASSWPREAAENAGDAARVRQSRGPAGRALHHRRGCRHERPGHDRGGALDAFRRGSSGRGEGRWWRPWAAHVARRVSRHQGRGEACAWQGQPPGLHIALQGAGSVATGVALHACAEGARLWVADVDQAKAEKLADATGGEPVSADQILSLEADVVSPCALGAILTEQTIAGSKFRWLRAERTISWRRRRRRAAARARNSLRTRLRHQRRWDHQRLHRISRRRRRGPGAAADRGDRHAAGRDLVREQGQRARSGGGRRRYGAEADRKGISDAQCTRSPIRLGSSASPGRPRCGCC